jgi:RNA polymerase sigma factor (sigma-70 family)
VGTVSEAEDPRHLIQRALAGDRASVRALVDRLSPTISRRVAATLWQRSPKRNVAQDSVDMVQEVFLALFQADGKALRAWDPERGMSLDSFVGLLAQHQVISLLRSGRTSPWREELSETAEQQEAAASSPSPEAVVSSREGLRVLLDRLQERLSPRGLELFQRLIVDEEPIETLSAVTGLTPDALYQWKRRLLKLIRSLALEMSVPKMSDQPLELRIAKEPSAL